MVPLTESRNRKSIRMDLMTSKELIDLFRKNEEEIYSGPSGAEGLFGALADISKVAETALEEITSRVISRVCMSGAGTSGRLSCLVSALCSEVYPEQQIIQYNINGGIGSYFRTPAGLEDDFYKGVREVRRHMPSDPFGLIGVSCGLSAPYVAGQILECLNHRRGFCSVLGFNPIEQARTEIRGDGFVSFHDVLRQARDSRNFVPMTPIVGPELLAGSVRLKSGTATLIVLAGISLWLLAKVHRDETLTADHYLQKLFGICRHASERFYEKNGALISELVDLAVSTLKEGGAIRLEAPDILGFLTVSDAAESHTTFCASFSDIIGSCDPKIWEMGKSAHLEDITSPPIQMLDGMCVTEPVQHKDADLRIALQLSSTVEIAIAKGNSKSSPRSLQLSRSEDPGTNLLLALIQIKLLMNIFSTATFIRRGRVFENVMINYRLWNAKLFDRAAALISELCRCTQDDARKSLLRSIYNMDDEAALPIGPTSSHVTSAAPFTEIVPTSLCLRLDPSMTVASARALVAQQAPLRQLLNLT